MSSVFSKMNNKTSKTPYIVAICSTIIACCLGGMLFFSNQNDKEYVTKDWVMDTLDNNYSSNMSDEQARTIMKTVSSRVETNMSDILKDVDLSTIMSQEDKEWLKRYIDDEVSNVAGDIVISPEKRSEITNEIIREIQSKSVSTTSDTSQSTMLSATELSNLKKDVEALTSTKSQLEKAVRDVEDAAKTSVNNEENARKKATEAADAAVKSLRESIEKQLSTNTSTTTTLTSKIKNIEESVNKLNSSTSTSELKSNIDELKSKLSSTESSLKSSIDSKNSEISDLSSKLSAASTKIGTLETDLATKANSSDLNAAIGKVNEDMGVNDIVYNPQTGKYERKTSTGKSESATLATFVTEALNKEDYDIEPVSNGDNTYSLRITRK